MLTFHKLLRESALRLGWQALEIADLAADINQLIYDLEQWRQQMQITQDQVTTLTTEIQGVKDALNNTNNRVAAIQSSLTTAQAEADTLKAQLADAGQPFDTAALDKALADAKGEADGIAQVVADAPTPVVPATDAPTPVVPATDGASTGQAGTGQA